MVWAMSSGLVVMGGGKMGEALVAGALGAGWAQPDEVVIVEVSAARRDQLSAPGSVAARFPGLVLAPELPERVEDVVVAVKPPDVEAACRQLEGRGARRVLSIAAGVLTGQLGSWCPAGCAVIRAMPNLAALVGASATAVTAGPGARTQDVEWASSFMRSVGSVVEVPEPLMDAVTGVSGSGPAYLMLVAEAMVEGGVLMGLRRDLCLELVAQTLLGAGRMLTEQGQAPEELRAAVTSPGGTTAAGLRQLEAHAVRGAVIEAVAAAAQRSQQLAH